MREEMGEAQRESKFYMSKVKQSKAIDAMQKRKGGSKRHTVFRKFKQRKHV